MINWFEAMSAFLFCTYKLIESVIQSSIYIVDNSKQTSSCQWEKKMLKNSKIET